MSGKTGLLVGLMIGLVIASGGVVASLLITGRAIKGRESAAWQAGYDTRAEHAVAEQKTISATLNQGLVDENGRLSESAGKAGAKLKDVLAYPDLAPEVRKLAEDAARELGEEIPAQPAPQGPRPYDDNLGKLESADASWRVSHILISWEGLKVPTKQTRTKEQARGLVDEIWAKFVADSSQANWAALQKQYNEDSVPHSTYDSSQSLIAPFRATAASTKIGCARIVESQFGFHLIRRES